MEQLTLTDPIVVPATTTASYRVIALTLNLEAVTVPGHAPGLITIMLRDNNNVASSFRYEGQQATDMIKVLNTANLSTKSMHKRILERLSADGLLAGTVTGTPDP